MQSELQPIRSDVRLRSREGNLNLTNGLQIHLLELPKYTLPSDNKVIADPVEAWAYFFRQADSMTTDEIQQRFNCPAFTEAAQVLDMTQRPQQHRSQYEQRLKAQRDERAMRGRECNTPLIRHALRAKHTDEFRFYERSLAANPSRLTACPWSN